MRSESCGPKDLAKIVLTELVARDVASPPEALLSVPFDVRNLVKLSVASDPRSSSFAGYPDKTGDLQMWGLIDQQNNHHELVNYNVESGHQPPGLFQATALSLGHLKVSVGYENIAELKV